LYRREIADNPGEALTERFAELMQTVAQPGLLASFVQWRWSAAGLLGRFEVIGEDLPGLRGRLAVDQEETWLRLLTFAADQLAWAPPSATASSLRLREYLRETARQEHLHLPCADVFDRLEYLERAAAGWHGLKMKGTVPPDLLELLSHFWTRPFPEIRRRVTAVLAAVAAEPDVWLAYLDRIKEGSPELLSIFGDILNSYQWTVNADADGRDAEELAVLARYFLEEHGRYGYRHLRPRLLAFCLREQIDPDVVAQVAISRTVILSEARLDKLVNDWPLRYVYRASTLFRN
jgi:hypothetical protein